MFARYRLYTHSLCVCTVVHTHSSVCIGQLASATWGDTKGPASLKVDNYAHGEDAAFDSWVLLVRKEDEASASNS